MNVGEQTGILIAVESADEQMREHHTQLLVNRLASDSYETVRIDFPRYTEPAGYFALQHVHGAYGALEDSGPYAAAMFYVLDFIDATQAIKGYLEQGKIVIVTQFSAACMARQARFLASQQERHGFFVWLDNLAFHVSQIPRPDYTVIIGTTAEVDTPAMSPHETPSIDDIYAEMASLFPRDFKHFASIRGDTALPTHVIHSLIWETIAPGLPTLSATSVQSASTSSNPGATRNQGNSDIEEIIFERVSLLALGILRTASTDTGIGIIDAEKQTDDTCYLPDTFDTETQDWFVAAMHDLRSRQAMLMTTLRDHATVQDPSIQTQYQEIERLLQPYALCRSIALSGSQSQFNQLADRLRQYDIPEIQTIIQRMMDTPIDQQQSHIADGNSMFQQSYTQEPHVVSGVICTPSNELDLVIDILASAQKIGRSDARRTYTAMTYTQKAQLFSDYFSRKIPSDDSYTILGHCRYSFDLMADNADALAVITPADLQRFPTMTPRYGYTIPMLIDATQLSDLYDEYFDACLAIYSQLQLRGYVSEAQYATLYGHKQMWNIDTDARLLHRLQANLTDSSKSHQQQTLTITIRDEIASHYPLLVHAICDG